MFEEIIRTLKMLVFIKQNLILDENFIKLIVTKNNSQTQSKLHYKSQKNITK